MSLICIHKNNAALDPKWKDIMIQGEKYMALAPVTVSRKSYKREKDGHCDAWQEMTDAQETHWLCSAELTYRFMGLYGLMELWTLIHLSERYVAGG